MKRAALQNKRVGVLRMAFLAHKDSGTFEKWAPGLSKHCLKGVIKTKTKSIHVIIF